MTDIYASSQDSPAEPDAPVEDTAVRYPEGERIDPETDEPIEPVERPASAPEHNQDGSRAGNF